MSKTIKVILGVFSIWPLIYMIIFMSFTFFMVYMGSSQVNQEPAIDFFKIIFTLHLLTMFEIMGLVIFYVVFIFKTDRVSKDKKALWAVVIFLGNMISMPIFWFLYIWKQPKLLQTS